MSAGHGKTVEDVGSEWLDGASTKYYIMRIVSSTQLWMLSENIGTHDKWLFDESISGVTLTHSSGATHTANITIDADVGDQMFPSVSNHIKTVYVDGVTDIENYSDGTIIKGSFVDIKDYYDIANQSECLDSVIADVGSLVQPDLNQGNAQIHISYNYRLLDNGSNSITFNLISYDTIDLNYFGVIQGSPLISSSYPDRYLYMPKVGTKNDGVKDWTLKNISDFSTAPNSLLNYDVADWG